MARPSPWLVQPWHVASPSLTRVPSGLLPVRMSCLVGPTCAPVSVSTVSAVRVAPSPWSSSTLAAISTPCALIHGPRPIRSRAWTAGVPVDGGALRYARHNRSPRPTAVARSRQIASAPSRPARLPPKPRPVLVTKNDILDEIAGASCPAAATAANSAARMTPGKTGTGKCPATLARLLAWSRTRGGRPGSAGRRGRGRQIVERLPASNLPDAVLAHERVLVTAGHLDAGAARRGDERPPR